MSFYDLKSQDRFQKLRLHRRPMSEINVTPFVDVMLVLLIVFMVTAPMLVVGVPIQLPKTAANTLPTEKEEPLNLSITKEGLILIQKTEIPQDQLITKLKSIFEERQSNQIFLRADSDVIYSVVAQVMGALNQAGFSNIALVMDAGGPSMDKGNE